MNGDQNDALGRNIANKERQKRELQDRIQTEKGKKESNSDEVDRTTLI
jgi:hypothetical protein